MARHVGPREGSDPSQGIGSPQDLVPEERQQEVDDEEEGTKALLKDSGAWLRDQIKKRLKDVDVVGGRAAKEAGQRQRAVGACLFGMLDRGSGHTRDFSL